MPDWIQTNDPEEWGERALSGAPDHWAADCGTEFSHERRLMALLRVPLKPGDQLVDLGCGTGRLADLLPDGVRYEGLDFSAGVVKSAQERRPQHTFRVGAVEDLRPADWIVASGPFNCESGWSREETFVSIRRMWEVSTRGIAVTVLRVPAEGRLSYTEGDLFSSMDGLNWDELHIDRSYLANDLCVRAWRMT